MQSRPRELPIESKDLSHLLHRDLVRDRAHLGVGLGAQPLAVVGAAPDLGELATGHDGFGLPGVERLVEEGVLDCPPLIVGLEFHFRPEVGDLTFVPLVVLDEERCLHVELILGHHNGPASASGLPSDFLVDGGVE